MSGKIVFPLLLLALLAVTTTRASEATSALPVYRMLAFYEVRPISDDAAANGRLSADQWKQIPAADTFYVYWKRNPEPGELSTAFQMAYDSRGIYLRIMNREPRMDAILAKKDSRGDPELWKDDCVQLYFDPACSGTGYLSFTINSLGIQGDRKQLDGSVSLDEWRGENWRTWVVKEKEAWIIEAFFPWSDLERKATPGDVWMFNPVRYGYSTGAFKGVSWALGGSYASPGYFGFLYFGGEKRAAMEGVAEVLRQKATPPWSVMLNDQIIRLANECTPRIAETAQVLDELRERARKLREEIEKLPGVSQESVRGLPESESSPASAVQAIEEENAALRELLKIYWNEKIRLLMEPTAAI